MVFFPPGFGSSTFFLLADSMPILCFITFNTTRKKQITFNIIIIINTERGSKL